jgi:hypothetical protein
MILIGTEDRTTSTSKTCASCDYYVWLRPQICIKCRLHSANKLPCIGKEQLGHM